jgi:hypothetical protein
MAGRPSLAQTVVKFAVYGAAGLAVGLGACALTTVDSEVARTNAERDSLEILKQYDPELYDVFVEVADLEEHCRRDFGIMKKSLVRLLTLELHFDKFLHMRTDWPRVASSYTYDVEQACAALSEYGKKEQLDRIVKVGQDIAHNIHVESSRRYLSADH